ncbi:right-handed parallel beta-helix repeat-containing protein [Curtobacterium sp. VKM Ac-1376]|uniref:right-handed parallel beta-helix repeat-containing protein n=1 Tax=Curtobacterium sp. VKM Ac-1376 TaxID=123312 RepID=UPI001889F7F9|nr:right-handed parallel beta-helix repeat-containing protein [Curtobacterium sp. VKM Ac-1376]MBF4614049.1 right-handed parallel beta-helix repeat-containing protein [Curtobacterium sp. VKM Ac-1376]
MTRGTSSRPVVTRRAALFGAASAIPVVLLPTDGAQASPGQSGRADVDARGARAAQSVSDIGAARLQDAVTATDPDGVLVVTRHWVLSEPLRIDRPLVIRFVGGSLSTVRDIDLVLVTVSGVTIVDAVLRGSGADHSGLGRGVHVAGTAARPLRDVHVLGADIRDFPHDGVLLEHCAGFSVDDSLITDIGYAGVLMFSCTDGAVRRNRIARIVQPKPYPNSYGIEAVRATTTGLVGAPRSARIVIADNHVSDVPSWEGIDTHGGQSIAILRNRVENCRVGIAIVPSKDESDASATKYAPLDCSVIDNIVHRTTPGPGSGIIIRGAGETVGDRAERANGMVLRNTVTGYGDGDRDGAVLVYLTRHLLIAHNHLPGGVRRGLSLYHSNDGIVLVGNRIAGLRTQGTATSVAIDVRASENRGHLMGNRYEGSAESGAVYGVLCRQTANDLVLVDNDWAATTTAVVAGAGAVIRVREG